MRRWPADVGIAHTISDPVEQLQQILAQAGRPDYLLERSAHAQQPGIALGYTDTKSLVPQAKSWVPSLLRVRSRPSEPFGEVLFQRGFAAGKIGRMQRTNGLRFRQAIHAIVKGLDDPIDRGLAAHEFEV